MATQKSEPCYFTCTLSQAAEWKARNDIPSFDTVLDLIDEQARLLPHSPALGIAGFHATEPKDSCSRLLTFEQLRILSHFNVDTLRIGLESIGVHDPLNQETSPKVVGVLSASDINFVATWLGLTRLGYIVFFLAPQLDSAAIQHLCETSQVKAIFADENRLSKIQTLESRVGVLPVPSASLQSIKDLQTTTSKIPSASASLPSSTTTTKPHQHDDVAYLMHTSGTSSGLPKPIPQTHRGAVGVVPRLNLALQPSSSRQQQVHQSTKTTSSSSSFPPTFTTTPLYHGGLADCFRSWCSGTSIWLFPEAECPMTATNVIRAVSVAREEEEEEAAAGETTATTTGTTTTTKSMYFSSVPYVLQLLCPSPSPSSSSGEQEEESGIKLLHSMTLVGVGGAALPDSLGDRLVQDPLNVRLVSRMGSAECGFLLSSDRGGFGVDKGWQYLRAKEQDEEGKGKKEMLSFEPRPEFGDGVAELVVGRDWPLRLKVNREDGGYATSDLFRMHPKIKGAWRYEGRADGMVTLVTGKKFDPGVVEDGILSSSAAAQRRDDGLLLRDVLVFGSGRAVAGALLFVARGGGGGDKVKGEQEQQKQKQAVLDDMWPIIESLNSSWPRHAALSRSSIVVVPEEEWAAAAASHGEDHQQPPLERSSKGTIIRAKANKKYAELIESVYRAQETVPGRNVQPVSDADLPEAIAGAVDEAMGRKLDRQRDLFQQGVDSIACIQLRRMLQAKFMPSGHGKDSLPMNVIYDCATVDGVISYIIRCRQELQHPDDDARQDSQGIKIAEQHQMMRDLTDKYSRLVDRWPYDLSQMAPRPTKKEGISSDEESGSLVVVLTGATGALGSHILHQLLPNPRVKRVLCLVRDEDTGVAHRRVSKALSSRHLFHPVAGEVKIECVPYDLFAQEDALGTSTKELDMSIRRASGGSGNKNNNNIIFIHAAWSVNFTLGLSSFERLIASTAALLNVSLAIGSHFHFVSSTAAVTASSSVKRQDGLITELESAEPADASPLGYSRSKWVAERICTNAAHDDRGNNGDISIMRVGQLCGDESQGIWNMSESYPLMLSTANLAGCLPKLKVSLDWLPVNVAASAVLDIAIPVPSDQDDKTRSKNSGRRHEEHAHSVSVYHILNPHQSPTWDQMLEWIIAASSSSSSEEEEEEKKEKEQGKMNRRRRRMSAESGPEWICRVEQMLVETGAGGGAVIPRDHPCRSLIGFWKTMLLAGEENDKEDVEGKTPPPRPPRFDICRARESSEVMRKVAPLDRTQVLGMWEWIRTQTQT